MNGRRGHAGDNELLRAAARRIAWQIALACAAALIVVGGVALFAARWMHHPHDGRPDGPHDLDDTLRTVAIVGGVLGIVVAGVIGFIIARRAVAPLGDALARQRRFVADAGHELRTPLTVLHTRAQLIARRMRPDDPARSAVDQLLDDSRALSDIVDDLLTSAQLGTATAHHEEFDLVEIARSIVNELGILADRAGITLTASGPEACPVRGSRTALRRAVAALVDNALAHTPEGGEVRITVTAPGPNAVIEVSDNGEGLPDDPDRLLERFAQADRTNTTVSGTRRYGLGLALVSEIATSHQGRLDLLPNPNGGTTARITVPYGGEVGPEPDDPDGED
jgi:signal transduction histidine kinase